MTALMSTAQTVVIGGVDSHADAHHAVAIDHEGRLLGDQQFPADQRGYRRLLDWLSGFGVIDRVGVESTSSYAAGLARFLLAHQVEVIEVNQPARQPQSRRGKTDRFDAESAARAALSEQAHALPKDTTGVVESIRVLRLTRDSAVRSRTRAIGQMRDVLTTAPAVLREQITAKSWSARATRCAGLRPDRTRLCDPLQAAKLALRTLARRIQALTEEIDEVERTLADLVHAAAPTLTSRVGIGTLHAAGLLVTAGQNIDRLHSEAAFARLCGAAPIPVSSGKTHRMRLHRGGNRQANSVLYLIAVCRLRYHQPTIDHMTRRRAEGLSKADVIRCLKRYIAREVYHDLKNDLRLT